MFLLRHSVSNLLYLGASTYIIYKSREFPSIHLILQRFLLQTLRKRGLEISPSSRILSQVGNLPQKNVLVEKHLYRCMAIAASSLAFSFVSSRWNLTAGSDNCVLQFQVVQQPDNQMVRASLFFSSPTRYSDSFSEHVPGPVTTCAGLSRSYYSPSIQ